MSLDFMMRVRSFLLLGIIERLGLPVAMRTRGLAAEEPEDGRRYAKPKTVLVMRPPQITTATGCRISLPGSWAAMHERDQAMPALSAVMRTGTTRFERASYDRFNG
jgi:hypothetical protein